MSTVTAPPRAALWRRRWVRLIALALVALVGLCAAISAYGRWQERQAWREACAEADRLDPGWRWDELLAARPEVSDECNGALHILAAAKLLPAATNNVILPAFSDDDWRASPNHRPSPQDIAQYKTYLNAAAPALAAIRPLADCPEGRLPIPASPVILGQFAGGLPYFSATKNLLYTQLILQAEAGEADAALDSVRSIVRASQPLADGPGLGSCRLAQVLRVATARGVERVLAQGEPSPPALDKARRLLEQEAGRPLMLTAYRRDRAVVEDTVRALDEGHLSLDELGRVGIRGSGVSGAPDERPWTRSPSFDEWINRMLGLNYRRSNALALVRHSTWAVERLKESPDGLRAHAAEWADLRARLPWGAKYWMDTFARCAEEMAVDDAAFRSAVAALAAEQFRQARGRWPTTLDELVPEFLTVVPRDPCDLQPLRLARRPDGIVIYGVGRDGKDDGGIVRGDHPPRVSDVGVRLWDVAQRRQPPLPPKAAGMTGQ
jgi:hypothetical protein